MRKKQRKYSSFIGLLFPLVLFFIGKWSGAIPPSDYSFSLYSSKRNGFVKGNPGFFLKEKIGIFPKLQKDINPDSFPRFQARMPGFVVLCDFNNDEFEDVITIYNKPDKFGLLEVFKNDNGNKFTRATNEIGLKESQENYSFTVAACADFDNDGWLDIVLGGIGQNLFVYKNHRGHFKKSSEILAFDETREINIFDANGDGYLDIYIGNFRFLAKGKVKMARRLRDARDRPPISIIKRQRMGSAFGTSHVLSHATPATGCRFSRISLDCY